MADEAPPNQPANPQPQPLAVAAAAPLPPQTISPVSQKLKDIKANLDTVGHSVTAIKAVMASLRADVTRLEAEKSKLKKWLTGAIVAACLSLVAFFVALAAVKVHGLSGTHVVEIVGIVVMGALIFCAFSFGRFMQVTAEFSEKAKKLKIEVGKKI